METLPFVKYMVQKLGLKFLCELIKKNKKSLYQSSDTLFMNFINLLLAENLVNNDELAKNLNLAHLNKSISSFTFNAFKENFNNYNIIESLKSSLLANYELDLEEMSYSPKFAKEKASSIIYENNFKNNPKKSNSQTEIA